MTPDSKKKEHGYPLYSDNDDGMHVVSQTDCTGVIPSSPASEAEAESYSDLYNLPQPEGPVNNGLQSIKKTKNNEDVKPRGNK